MEKRVCLLLLTAFSLLSFGAMNVWRYVSPESFVHLINRKRFSFLLLSLSMSISASAGIAFEGESNETETQRGNSVGFGQCNVTGDVRSSNRQAIMRVEDATLTGGSTTVGGTAWRQGELLRLPSVDAQFLTNVCKLFDVGSIEQFGADQSSSFEAQTEMYLHFTARRVEGSALERFEFTMGASGFIRHGVSPELSYFLEPAIQSADICNQDNRAENVASSLAGNIHGTYYLFNDYPTDRMLPLAQIPIISIDIWEGTALSAALGGNTYYSGDLIEWENSWFFCMKEGSHQFRSIDNSQPFLRIFPVEESLGDDGHYQQFRTEDLWRSADSDPASSWVTVWGIYQP